jgi:hypothetical protein
MNKVLVKVGRMDLARNEFPYTETFPLNRNIFNDIDFLPSQVTGIPQYSSVKISRFENEITCTLTPLTSTKQ